jgi:Glycosyl transferases group 1
MKVTLITTRLFEQARSGGEICTARLLSELLLAGHQVHVVGRGDVPATATPSLCFSSLGPLVAPFDELPKSHQFASLLMALGTRRASTVQRLSGGGVTQHIERLLLAPGATATDVLVVDHLQAYAWVAPLQSRLPRPLLVMHNVESDGYWERAREGEGHGLTATLRTAIFRREASLMKALEELAWRQAAVVACLSTPDVHRMQELAAQTGPGLAPQMDVLPAFPTASMAFDKRPQAPPHPQRPLRIGMLGTWTWGPNRAGLRWMLEAVLPHLPAPYELWLAGSGLQDTLLPAGVRHLGRIDDVPAFYASVDVVAIASLGGSGVQEKAVEAIGSGRPVVATSHALRGLSAAPTGTLPSTVNSSDDAAQFARLCQSAATANAHDSHDSARTVQQWARQRQLVYRQALSRCLQAATALVPG